MRLLLFLALFASLAFAECVVLDPGEVVNGSAFYLGRGMECYLFAASEAVDNVSFGLANSSQVTELAFNSSGVCLDGEEFVCPAQVEVVCPTPSPTPVPTATPTPSPSPTPSPTPVVCATPIVCATPAPTATPIKCPTPAIDYSKFAQYCPVCPACRECAACAACPAVVACPTPAPVVECATKTVLFATGLSPVSANCSRSVTVNGTAFCADGFEDCPANVLWNGGERGCWEYRLTMKDNQVTELLADRERANARAEIAEKNASSYEGLFRECTDDKKNSKDATDSFNNTLYIIGGFILLGLAYLDYRKGKPSANFAGKAPVVAGATAKAADVD